MIDGMSAPTAVPLELRHIQVLDRNRDGVISRGEGCRVVFEIYNPTSQVAFGVRPMVSEVTGNRHILISENVLIESIAPKQAVRYTAMVKADNRLKNEAITALAPKVTQEMDFPDWTKDQDLLSFLNSLK